MENVWKNFGWGFFGVPISLKPGCGIEFENKSIIFKPFAGTYPEGFCHVTDQLVWDSKLLSQINKKLKVLSNFQWTLH